MQAFLTGSHAYGTPREDSDIDLVIRCDEETAKFLSAQRDPMADGSPAIKFGKMNFIPCTTDEQYNAWRAGTTALQYRKPVAREKDCEMFISLLKPKQFDKCSQ